MTTGKWMDREDVVCGCVCVCLYTYIHTDGILLCHQKEWNYAICNNMNGLRNDHIKWSASEIDKCHMCGI